MNKHKRKLIYAITAGLCWYCGINSAETIDHLVPLRRGGAPLSSANLLPACRKCNGHKSHLTLEEYRLLVWYKLVKSTHVDRMTLSGFYEDGLFYGERLAKKAESLSTPMNHCSASSPPT